LQSNPTPFQNQQFFLQMESPSPASRPLPNPSNPIPSDWKGFQQPNQPSNEVRLLQNPIPSPCFPLDRTQPVPWFAKLRSARGCLPMPKAQSAVESCKTALEKTNQSHLNPILGVKKVSITLKGKRKNPFKNNTLQRKN
jgi:hypothetical protein